MNKWLNKIFLFLGIFMLFWMAGAGEITVIDIVFNIIMSIVTTILIDWIVIELPIRQKVNKMLIQLETINCFYVLAFWFMLNVHEEIYLKQKKHLSQVTQADVENEVLKEAFVFFRRFALYLQSETSNYANIDSLIKINIASVDSDEIWQYSCDVQRFYELFLPLCTAENYELEFVKQLAYAEHNCADLLANVLQDITVMYNCVGNKGSDVFSSLVLGGRRYFAGFGLIELRGYLKQWEAVRKYNYLD